MHTDSSAIRTCSACRSAVEYTATVGIPSSRHARMIRIAMVPRFATNSFLNICGLGTRRAVADIVSADLDDHQWLPKLHRRAILDHAFYHAASEVRLDLGHHLNRFNY